MKPVLIVTLLLTATQPVWADDEFPLLPAGEGRDVLVRVCSKCHSPEKVTLRPRDADGWNALIDKMANNGARGTGEEYDTIIKYLTTAFAVK